MYKAQEEAVSRQHGICDGGKFWIQRNQATQGPLKQPPSQPLQNHLLHSKDFYADFLFNISADSPLADKAWERLALQISQCSKHIVGWSLSRLSRAEAAGIEPFSHLVGFLALQPEVSLHTLPISS